MKAVCLFAFCLLAGAVSTEYAWKVGKSYTYAVRGRVMSGITEINTQYAGLEMNYNVVLTITGENTINLKPMHLKLVEVNDKIHGGWRDGEFREERPVELTEEFRGYLESPIEFTLEKGIVTSLKVESNLPLWAINMKKAQVSHFVLDTTGVNRVLKGNLDRNVRPEEHKHEAGYFYETLEKTVHGECRTYYTVSQNLPFVPPFPFQKQVQPSMNHNSEESHEVFHHENVEKIEADSREEHQAELPWHKNFHQFCKENDMVFEIIKSVNFTDCKQKPVLGYYSPAASMYNHASENGAGSFAQRALVSRYLACGVDRKHFTILKLRLEEQMKVGTHLVKKMVAGAIQNITLIEITEAKQIVHLKNPKNVKTLIYTFNHEQGLKDTTTYTKSEEIRKESSEEMQMDAAYINGQKSSEEIEEMKSKFPEMENFEKHALLPKPTLREAPLNGLLASPLKIVGMKRRIELLMKEIVEDITKPTGKESMAQKETLSKISTIAKMLRYFSYNDIEEIYRQYAEKKSTDEDKVRRNTIIDCISIAGTNPNIKFLIDMIQKRVITGDRAARVIMTFPMYIRTPTVELLKELFNFVKTAPHDVEYVQVKTTATLALSTLLHQACVNAKIRNTRYPVAMYGLFCDAKIVENEFYPYFVEQLEKYVESENKEDTHWKDVYMTALGNIGHPKIIPVVQKLMDKIVNPFIRVKVVLMFKHLIVSRTHERRQELEFHGIDQTDILTDEIVLKKVVPILVSCAFDKGEHPEVRIAAIALLFRCNKVDVTLWQQIAYMTWFEVSLEVHSYVYQTLKNLAELKKYSPEINYRLVRHARFVFALCKPIHAGYTKSRTMFSTDYIHEHLSGYVNKLSYWGSKDSMLPNMVHYKNWFQYGNGAFEEVPMEFYFHGHSTQKLINYLLEQVYQPTAGDREAHEDVAQIREILGIKERKQNDAVEGRFYMKIQNEMERMFSFDKHMLEKLIKQFKLETLPKLRNGYPINFQKTFHLREHLMEVPTIFGFPATYNFRMPVHVSLRGLVKLVTVDNLKDMQIQAELHPVYAWKTHEKLSFKVPFLNKKYQTGFQRHVVAEFPFRALVRVAPRGQIEVAVTPAHLKQQEHRDINLVTFHQKPYTAIITDSCWPTTHKEGGLMKIVHTLETPTKRQHLLGKNTLGLSFNLESETEYRIENEGKGAWYNYFNRFHSWTSLFNLNWMGEPSLHLSKRQLSLDMSQSETKTFVFVFGRERQMTHNKMEKDSEEKHSEEDKTEKNVRLYAWAFIGKKDPIQSIYRSTGIQKILEKGTTSTVQYLWEVYMTRGHFNLQFAAGKAAKEVAMTFHETSSALQAIREYIVECPLMNIQRDMCVKFVNKYDRPIWANRRELIVLRKRLLSEELVVKIESELKFGQSCAQLPYHIKMQGNLRRDQEMTEWALRKSPKALKCIEDEKKGFTVSPVCLWVSEQQAAALNKWNLEFNYELPALFKNYLYRVEDYFKTLWYPYVSHDRYPTEGGAGEKKLNVEFRMTPNKEYFNLHLVKPNTRLTYENVKTTEWIKRILPLTSTQNMFENIRDRTLRFYSEPSCTLEGKYVNTFDNVTYRFSPKVVEKCQHVLTQDCSGKYPMTVLVKDINTVHKIVTILLGGKTKIEIVPQGSGLINRGSLVNSDLTKNFIVLVNGRQIQNFPEVIRLPEHSDFYHKYIAKIELMVNGGVQVISPRIRVATDAARVVIYGSNAYRNRTCGLCGNFDGEKVAELRSPKNCPLSSGSLLVASYAFKPIHAKDDVCKIDPEIKQRVEREENDCKRTRVQLPKYFLDNSEEKDMTTEDKYINKDSDCEINQRINRRVPELGMCKSELVVRHCREGCVAKSVVPKHLWFTCTQKSTVYPRERLVRKNLMIDEPTECVRGY